jgi:hypothetical protein
MEERRATTEAVDYMINFIKEEKGPNLAPKGLLYPTKGTLSITKERMNFKKPLQLIKIERKCYNMSRRFPLIP